MINRTRYLPWFCLVLFTLMHVGCGNESSSTRALIGITVMSSENPFFNVLANAAAAEAKIHGYASEILSGDNDPDKQDRQIKDFVAKKVSAIIISPCNAHAIGASIKSANAAGIPVFMADTGCTDESAEVVSTIETANYDGGMQASVRQ